MEAPAAPNPEYSVLDGQQRLTSLYLTLRGLHPRHTFYVDLGAILKTGIVEEEHFNYLTNRAWKDKYGSSIAQANARVITIDTLVSDARFFGWLSHISNESDRSELSSVRQNELGGLSNYQFPVAVVSKTAPLEILTNIFVTINQQGQKLSVFDLVVAKTWVDPTTNPPGYDIREIWETAVGLTDVLPAYPMLANFDVDEVTPLRLVHLLTSSGKDPSNKNIMNLDDVSIRSHYDKALKALNMTLHVLQRHAGVIPETLPSETGILPLAYTVSQKPGVLTDTFARGKMLRWFWASTFLQRYGRGATLTLVVDDAKEAHGWIAGTEPTPPWISEFWSRFEKTSLAEMPQTNEVLLKGMLSLQNFRGARDWETSELVSTLGRAPAKGGLKPVSRIDFHHVFPSDNDLNAGDATLDDGRPIPANADILLNRVAILQSTNRRLHAAPPSSLPEKNVDLESVASHLIDLSTLTSWPTFVLSRVALICAALESEVPLETKAATA